MFRGEGLLTGNFSLDKVPKDLARVNVPTDIDWTESLTGYVFRKRGSL